MRRVVQTRLEPIANDEQKQGSTKDRIDGHGGEADEREDRQRHDRVLHAEPVQHPWRHKKTHDQLHHVADQPRVADQDGQLLQVVVRGCDKEDRDEIVAHPTHDLEDEGQHDEGQHEAAADHMLERPPQDRDRPVPFALDLMSDEKLVRLIAESGSEQRALEADRHDGGRDRAERPNEDQRLRGEDGHDRGREAGKDVADARAGRDHGKDALAFQDVEVLGDEAPEVEHHQLERDGVDDIGGEGDRGVLAERVCGEDADRHDGVGDQGDSKCPPHAESPGQRALQRGCRPYGEGQDDEEERVRVRPRLGEKDRLGGAERRVHRPADDDREAGHLESAPELGAPNVKDLREERRYRLLPLALTRSAGRWRSSAGRRCALRSAGACRTGG